MGEGARGDGLGSWGRWEAGGRFSRRTGPLRHAGVANGEGYAAGDSRDRLAGTLGQGLQPGQGATELGFQAPGEMQSEADPWPRRSWWSRSARPRPIRAVQRRLCITCTASQAPLRRAPRRLWFSPTPYLRLWRSRMIGLQFEQLPVPVGDEAVIAVSGEEGQLGTGCRLHPPESRAGGASGLVWNGV